MRSDRAGRHWGRLQLDCVAFGTDASKIGGSLPSPDAALTARLHATYHAAMVYAEACVADKGHPPASATKALAAAQAGLAQAKRQMAALGAPPG